MHLPALGCTKQPYSHLACSCIVNAIASSLGPRLDAEASGVMKPVRCTRDTRIFSLQGMFKVQLQWAIVKLSHAQQSKQIDI
jgi:hypothetical protein